MSHEPIRVGLIGCGQFMSRQHIQTVARSPRLGLAHLADLDRDKLERTADRYRPARTSTDWRSVVSDANVDVVVVGVLPDLHPEICLAALKHGKPVYVEKPLAPTLEGCRAVQRAAAEQDVPVAVGFNRRFAPATELLATAFRSASPPVSVVYRITDDDRIRPPQQKWKLQDRLLIEVVHIFDLLTYLIGAEPVRVYATEKRYNDALATVDFANGGQASVLSSSYGSLAQSKEQLQAVLDHAAVEMEDFVEFRSYGRSDLPLVQRFAGRPYDDCDNSHVEDFARRGREALLELRRRYERAMSDSGVLQDSSNQQAWDRAKRLLGDPPPPQINYAPDKGWGHALETFCVAAAQGAKAGHAGPVDGSRAVVCALSARRSIETGRPVELDPRDWLLGQ